MRPSKASSSTAPGLKRPRSPSPSSSTASTDAAVKSILNSRKCWRSLKGKEEPVWPPQLEAALIEGLERYKPSESKSTRTLGRFPMRNKFVADHIFETTGVRRTPKQVGSRIQQLRDTQSGKQILKVISDRHYELMHPHRAAGPSRGGACALQAAPPAAPLSPSHIWVQTLPASAAWRFAGAAAGDLHSTHARPLRLVNPTVTFSSLSQTPCQSVFSVFRHGALVHQEVAPVAVARGVAGAWLYSTTLAPKYWPTLCDAEDPTAYAVHQEVTRVPLGGHAPAPPLLAVCYHFVHGGGVPSPPPLSPRSLSSGDSDASSLSRESSPTYLHDADARHYGSGSACAFPSSSQLLFAPYDAEPASPLDAAWGGYGGGAAPEAFATCDPIFEPYIDL